MYKTTLDSVSEGTTPRRASGHNYAVDFVDLKQRLPFGSRPKGSESFSFLSSQQKGKIMPFDSQRESLIKIGRSAPGREPLQKLDKVERTDRPLRSWRLCGENSFSKS